MEVSFYTLLATVTSFSTYQGYGMFRTGLPLYMIFSMFHSMKEITLRTVARCYAWPGRVEIRQTNPLRTAGVVGVFAGAAATGIAQLFVDREPGSTDIEVPPPNEHILRTLLHVTLFSC